MKTRIKIVIAIVSGIAVIALIIGLVSCNKKASPDISSFSSVNESVTEVTTESIVESVASVPSEEVQSSSVLQTNESNQEVSTETTKNIEVASSTQQTSQQQVVTRPRAQEAEIQDPVRKVQKQHRPLFRLRLQQLILQRLPSLQLPRLQNRQQRRFQLRLLLRSLHRHPSPSRCILRYCAAMRSY